MAHDIIQKHSNSNQPLKSKADIIINDQKVSQILGLADKHSQPKMGWKSKTSHQTNWSLGTKHELEE